MVCPITTIGEQTKDAQPHPYGSLLYWIYSVSASECSPKNGMDHEDTVVRLLDKFDLHFRHLGSLVGEIALEDDRPRPGKIGGYTGHRDADRRLEGAFYSQRAGYSHVVSPAGQRFVPPQP